MICIIESIMTNEEAATVIKPIRSKAAIKKGKTSVSDTVVGDAVVGDAVVGDAVPSKRARRPRVVYGSGMVSGIPAYTSDDENVILKLSFADAGLQSHPDPYECDADTFVSKPCQIDAMDGTTCSSGTDGGHHMICGNVVDGEMYTHAASSAPGEQDPPPRTQPPLHHPSGLKVIRLLTEFEEKNKNGEWPSSTSVHCYWCCHRFNNAPFGLPIKFANDEFHVVGCFCSLECACAYNFAGKNSVDECLNRYTLVNSLASRLGLGRVVKPAPDRLALNIFGGHLCIEEFRAFAASNRHILVNSPPMLTVTQQVEEVNDSDLRSEYRYIPLDSERISRYQEKIRLKRSKPLVNFKNTLDHTMKLRIGG